MSEKWGDWGKSGARIGGKRPALMGKVYLFTWGRPQAVKKISPTMPWGACISNYATLSWRAFVIFLGCNPGYPWWQQETCRNALAGICYFSRVTYLEEATVDITPS